MRTTSTDQTGVRSGGAWLSRIGVVAVLVGVLVVVVVSNVSGGSTPFDLDSSAPDGYGAVRMLLEANGIAPRTATASSSGVTSSGEGSVIVVPAPQMLTKAELQGLADAVDRGATVIYGSPPPSGTAIGDVDDLSDAALSEQLAELPAELEEPRTCMIEELADLGAVDVVLADQVQVALQTQPVSGIPTDASAVGSCYGNGEYARFVDLRSGQGRVIVMSSPYMWANARLASGSGGTRRVLDNGVTALRLIAPRRSAEQSTGPEGQDTQGTTGTQGTTDTQLRPATVVFVPALPSAAALTQGTKGLIELLPVAVRALLVALLASLGLFVWTRAVRLGPPVEEVSQVTIESSEFTAAVGRLFEDDPAFISSGAMALRRTALTTLGRTVGLPAGTDPRLVCQALAGRTMRAPAEIDDLLCGTRPVTDGAELVELERMIEQLRTEVGDAHSR